MKLPIEFSLSLTQLAFAISDPITRNLVIYRTCSVTLSLNETICALLGTKYHDNVTMEYENMVQPYATVLLTTKFALENFATACLCIFIGPWSDKYGRRPVLLFTLGGYSIAYFIILIVGIFKNISPWFLLISTSLICISGGFPAYFTAAICYVVDTTTSNNRGFRMGVIEGTVIISELLGNLSCAYIFNRFGYVVIYQITVALIFLAFSNVLFGVPESINMIETNQRRTLCALFDISLVRDMLKTTFRRRNDFDRFILLTIILIMVLYLFVVTADGDIVFLYLRHKLNWSLELYTYYISGRTIATIIGTFIGCIVLNKMFNVPEAYLILFGFISTCSSAIWQGIATKNEHIYIAGITKFFSGNISPMARSLVSKIIISSETGKVFSCIRILQTFIDTLGPPIYTFIYNNTLSVMSGVFNFVTAGIYVIEIILTIYVIIMQTTIRQNYQPMPNIETANSEEEANEILNANLQGNEEFLHIGENPNDAS